MLITNAHANPSFTLEALPKSVRVTLHDVDGWEPLSSGTKAPIGFYIYPTDLKGVLKVEQPDVLRPFLIGASSDLFRYLPSLKVQTYSVRYEELKVSGWYEEAGGKWLGPLDPDYLLSHDWKPLFRDSRTEVIWYAKNGEGSSFPGLTIAKKADPKMHKTTEAEQGGAGRPATSRESDSEGSDGVKTSRSTRSAFRCEAKSKSATATANVRRINDALASVLFIFCRT